MAKTKSVVAMTFRTYSNRMDAVAEINEIDIKERLYELLQHKDTKEVRELISKVIYLMTSLRSDVKFKSMPYYLFAGYCSNDHALCEAAFTRWVISNWDESKTMGLAIRKAFLLSGKQRSRKYVGLKHTFTETCSEIIVSLGNRLEVDWSKLYYAVVGNILDKSDCIKIG